MAYFWYKISLDLVGNAIDHYKEALRSLFCSPEKVFVVDVVVEQL